MAYDNIRMLWSLFSEYIYPSTNATPASTTGSDHAQFPNQETAKAPSRQPIKKPPTRGSVSRNRSPDPGSSGEPCAKVSRSESTAVVKLPLITAVEGAPPGTASRKSAN